VAPSPPGSPRDAQALILSGRADSVSDEGLVEVLLGSGAVAVEALLDAHPIPEGLWRVGAEELTGYRGVGPATAARMLACLEMSRRAPAWAASERPVVSGPEDVVRLCSAQFRGLDREHFWALPLNTKNQLLKTVEVSVGSLNAAIVHPRELFREAVRLSAASIVVVHNHPSGDPAPSGADVTLTRRLVKAGDVLGIDLLDHVVIGDGGDFVSLREGGLM
jgi:DNA repair protein RadC